MIEWGSQPVILPGAPPVAVGGAQGGGYQGRVSTPQVFPAHLGHFERGGEEQCVEDPPGGGENPPPQQRHHALHHQGGQGSGAGGVGEGQENQGTPLVAAVVVGTPPRAATAATAATSAYHCGDGGEEGHKAGCGSG